MKRALVLSILAVALFALPAAHVWGKGHVPAAKIQVCHKGKTITVSSAALGGHLRHGDCQLPACDFNNVFMNGDACPPDGDDEGRCIVANPRDEADTPACPPGTF